MSMSLYETESSTSLPANQNNKCHVCSCLSGPCGLFLINVQTKELVADVFGIEVPSTNARICVACLHNLERRVQVEEVSSTQVEPEEQVETHTRGESGVLEQQDVAIMEVEFTAQTREEQAVNDDVVMEMEFTARDEVSDAGITEERNVIVPERGSNAITPERNPLSCRLCNKTFKLQFHYNQHCKKHRQIMEPKKRIGRPRKCKQKIHKKAIQNIVLLS